MYTIFICKLNNQNFEFRRNWISYLFIYLFIYSCINNIYPSCTPSISANGTINTLNLEETEFLIFSFIYLFIHLLATYIRHVHHLYQLNFLSFHSFIYLFIHVLITYIHHVHRPNCPQWKGIISQHDFSIFSL